MGIYRVDAIESEVRARLKAPTNAHLASSTILQAINDGYRDVASRAFCIENEDTVTTVSGSRIVPFNGHRVNFVERITPSSSVTSGAWVERTGPDSAQTFSGIAFGNGTYCAVGQKAGICYIKATTDLENWSAWTNPGANDVALAVAYGNSVFCAALYATKVLVSSDGITWGIYTLATGAHFKAVAFGNGIFCGVGAHASTLTGIFTCTSSNGTSWTNRTHPNPLQMTMYAVGYGNGIWVAGGGNSTQTGTGYLEYSTDNGATWTASTTTPTRCITGIVWAGTRFIAVGKEGNIYTSTDGDTWETETRPKFIDLWAVAYNGGDALAVGTADGTDAYAIKSSDAGETWTEMANSRNITLKAICVGTEYVVAIGSPDPSDVYTVSSEIIAGTDHSSHGSLLKIRPENCGHISIKDNTPQYWFQWGNNVVIEPVPDAAYSLKLYVSDYPTAALSASTDSPSSLPSEFHSCIVDFTCYALSLKMKKWNIASRYYRSYITNLRLRRQDYINRKADRRSTHNIPGTVTYRGGKPWAH